MIKVRYKKYHNDFNFTMEIEYFGNLNEFADWMFDKAIGKYSDSMYFVDPDKIHERNGELYLDNSCIQVRENYWSYWVEQIEKDGKIIYSTGKFTNGIRYWNEEIKQWLRDCRKRVQNPSFDFG